MTEQTAVGEASPMALLNEKSEHEVCQQLNKVEPIILRKESSWSNEDCIDLVFEADSPVILSEAPSSEDSLEKTDLFSEFVTIGISEKAVQEAEEILNILTSHKKTKKFQIENIRAYAMIRACMKEN